MKRKEVLKALLDSLIDEHRDLVQKGANKEAALMDREIKRLKRKIGE